MKNHISVIPGLKFVKIFSKHLIVPEAHSFNSVLKVEVEKEKNVLRLAARCQVTLPIARGPTLSSTRASDSCSETSSCRRRAQPGWGDNNTRPRLLNLNLKPCAPGAPPSCACSAPPRSCARPRALELRLLAPRSQLIAFTSMSPHACRWAPCRPILFVKPRTARLDRSRVGSPQHCINDGTVWHSGLYERGQRKH